MQSLLGLWGRKPKSNDALHAIRDEDIGWCELEAKIALNLHNHRSVRNGPRQRKVTAQTQLLLLDLLHQSSQVQKLYSMTRFPKPRVVQDVLAAKAAAVSELVIVGMIA